jgi:hypothetical protein
MRNSWLPRLVLGMLLLATSSALSAEEKTDDIAKNTVEKLLKQIKEKNVKEVMKIVDVPFYWDSKPNPHLLKTKEGVEGRWKGLLTESEDLEKVEFTIKETLTLDKYVDSTGKKLSTEEEKILTELLGGEHRIYRTRMKWGERDVILSFGVRVKDKKGTVVGVFR